MASGLADRLSRDHDIVPVLVPVCACPARA